LVEECFMGGILGLTAVAGAEVLRHCLDGLRFEGTQKIVCQ
jgi:hypothetical protein